MRVTEITQHAALGALVSGGGITAAQCLLARKLQPPSSFALSLGSFVGVFRLFEAIGREHEKQEHDDSQTPVDTTKHGDANTNSSRAAAIAALVTLALLDGRRKNVVIAYAAIEAMLALSREYMPSIANTKYIEIVLGVPAYAQIIHTWVMKSELLEKSQIAALDGLCAIGSTPLRRMREEIPTGKLLSRCDVFHRGETCAQFHRGYFSKSMRFAARLYIPIYFFSVVVTKYKQWLWGPRPELSKLVIQYLRTCLCLTLNYQIPLFLSCHSPIKSHRVTVTVAGAFASLALLAEHERRRASVLKAIAVYSLCSAGAHAAATLSMPKSAVTKFQYALFAASLAMIFQRPERQSRTIMKYLYGYDVAAKQQPQSSSLEHVEPPIRDGNKSHESTSEDEEEAGAAAAGYDV